MKDANMSRGIDSSDFRHISEHLFFHSLSFQQIRNYIPSLIVVSQLLLFQ